MTDLKDIKFRIQTATEADVLLHLKACNADFIPPLSQKVDLSQYAAKLFSNALTFEAWDNNLLAGLIAAYFNKKPSGFITNVSVLNQYKGFGLASQLMLNTIDYAKTNGFTDISLEVNANNAAAVALYEKYNFHKSDFNTDSLIMKLNIK